jgi:hypothetical protein
MKSSSGFVRSFDQKHAFFSRSRDPRLRETQPLAPQSKLDGTGGVTDGKEQADSFTGF